MTAFLAPRYAFFGLAALSLMMFSIDGTIVAVAIPTMTRELHTSLAWIGWTLTGYQLTQTVMLPLVGKLAESFGRARVFFACVLLFTLGSLLCGIAPNVYVLIAFRVLQAVGGGGFMPSAVGIITEEFPEHRARMVGLFASIFPIGGVIGPNLGGFIIEHASWRDVFLVNVPIGVVVMTFLLRRVRRSAPIARRRVDMLGAGLFAGAITALLGALTLLGQDPAFLRQPPFWLLVALSLTLLGLFVRQERRAPEPILDMDLVVKNPFMAVNAYGFVFGACVFGFFSFIPYYAQMNFGFGPTEAGAILTPRSLAMMLTATVASFFLIRFGYRLPMVVGMLLVSCSLFLLSRGWTGAVVGGVQVPTFVLLAAEVLLAGIGMGLSAPASNNAALDLLPERAAVLTGIRGMFRSTGGVIGTALIVLALEVSPDKAVGIRNVFFVLSGGLLLTLPLMFFIPDVAREKRREQAARRARAIREEKARGVAAD